MNEQLAQQAYEQIDNYILRLLLYSLAAQIATLGGVVVYLFRVFRQVNIEAIDREKDMTGALTEAAQAYENVSERLESLEKLINQKHGHGKI